MQETDTPPPTNDPTLQQLTNPENGDSIPLRTLCADLHAKIEAFLQEDVKTEILKNVQSQCRHSLSIISEALEKYPYAIPLLNPPLTPPPKTPIPLTLSFPLSLISLSLSYNGGKDCLVLLLLYLSLLSTHPHLPPSLPAILIPPAHPFPPVDAFIQKTSSHYHLSLSRYTAPSPSGMKAAFASYLAHNPSIQAIFVGTRRTDPHGGELKPFEMTDRGWPSFMRVHPVLEWRYREVWAFLRWMGVEYCELYERGFTSLGGTNDTVPNPRLRVEGVEGRYWPAWMLEDEGEERAGRIGGGG